MSQHTRQMHDSFTRLLIVQATLPLVLIFLPEMSYILVATLLPIGDMSSVSGLILSMMVSTIPLANFLSTIVIVPNYRKILLGKCSPVIIQANVSDWQRSDTQHGSSRSGLNP